MTTPPFAGLTVLSLAEQYPGPYATMILSDLGADVVLVERPQGGDPARQFPGFFEALNRGKRSVVIDLKAPEGRQAFLDLAADADAVLEGFRPGTAERLGVGYEAVRAVKPDIVYVSISGFGQDGPYRLRAGHDVSYQALSGLLYERAELADPGLPPSVLVADLSAGMFAALAVVTGWLRRERHAEGSYIDVAMTDGLVSWMTSHLHPLLNDLGDPGLPAEPAYGLFHTADGRVISLSIAHEDRFWNRLCELCGMLDAADLSGVERRADVGRLRARLAGAMLTRPRDEWQLLLDEAGIPAAPVHDLHEVVSDPQVAARGLIREVPAQGDKPGRKYVSQPLRISGIESGPHSHAPDLGEHTEEIARRHPGLGSAADTSPSSAPRITNE